MYEPVNDWLFYPHSHIPATGETLLLGETVTIKLMRAGVQEDAHNATAPPQGINWYTEFNPTGNGWALSDYYTCELWSYGAQRISHDMYCVDP
jgi:hypothetical protein